MPSYKLIYFNARARGETPRVIMAYGDIPYEDVRVPEDDTWMNNIKPTMPFGQLPVLEVDGVQICQSEAIARFLAKKVGLHGKSDIEEAKIDMIAACFADIVSPLDTLYVEINEERKAELRKACQESLDEGLKKFEKLIEGDYFVGNQLTWADINVAEGLDMFSDLGVPVKLDKVPKLAGLVDRVKAQPKIAAWIAKRPQTPS